LVNDQLYELNRISTADIKLIETKKHCFCFSTTRTHMIWHSRQYQPVRILGLNPCVVEIRVLQKLVTLCLGSVLLCLVFKSFLRRGRDHMVVRFTTTYAISAYDHSCCEFESRPWQGVQHYVIKFPSDLRQVGSFLQVLRFPPLIKLTTTISQHEWS
jgi:hypothetical protein